MSLLKEVLAGEVVPALGCTEPIAVAYAAALAASEVRGKIDDLRVSVDLGVYKNGMAVAIPNAGGARGNLIAAALGAIVRAPDLKLEVLRDVGPAELAEAEALVRSGRVRIDCDVTRDDLYIEAVVGVAGASARAVIAGGHTDVARLERDGRAVRGSDRAEEIRGAPDAARQERGKGGYRSALRKATMADLIDAADGADRADLDYIREGIEMNRRIAREGIELRKVGYYLQQLIERGYLLDDVFSATKILTACATDARMDGMNLPVMSSGGSGNQGIVAILVPDNVGRAFGIPEEKILRSIALSHLVNAYVKSFTGGLSPVCGCAIAAGVGAAMAIVYQQEGRDPGKMALAASNLLSDLGGMLCDGAKSGCALKVVSSTDSAIRSGYMAIHGYGITAIEGFVGETAERTIQNLGRISDVGMARVDETILDIMVRKQLLARETEENGEALPGPTHR